MSNLEKTLDPVIPNSLIGMIKEAFKIQLSANVDIKGTEISKPDPVSGIEIVSVLGMKGKSFAGTLALCFPKKTFLGVVNQMLGESYSEINQENSDAASELLNIMYGNARVKINNEGHEFLPALPTIIRGQNIGVIHPEVSHIFRINCECEHGSFHVEISLKRDDAASKTKKGAA